MNIHFIGIGGAAMHNLAIALHLSWHHITWSDQTIFDPAYSRLSTYHLLPDTVWRQPDRIHNALDIVILGMVAFDDNPERIRAKELWVKIMSYPEFVYEMSKDKLRVVIGWSHGKTTTTGMIMHVLRLAGRSFDYLVWSIISGFEVMVQLSDAPVIIIEWDEYPDSKINVTPKFHVYRHHIWVINGIDWDHINIYKTKDSYVDLFRTFVNQTPSDGIIYYNQSEPSVMDLMKTTDHSIKTQWYWVHPYEIKDGNYCLITSSWRSVPLQVIGEHNMINISAAQSICKHLGVTDDQFYDAIRSFQPALNRLNKIVDNNDCTVYKDFAHSPSKLQATCRAIRQLYPSRPVIGIFELHTYSSLSKDFFVQYADHFNDVDRAILCYSPEVVERKRLASFDDEDIRQGFHRDDLIIMQSTSLLGQWVKDHHNPAEKPVYLFMSSWSFDWLNIVNLF